MKWIVGIDLRPQSDGPVRFAAWLREQLESEEDSFAGVHVLEREQLEHIGQMVDRQEATRQTQSTMTRVLADAGASAVLSDPKLVVDEDAEDGLSHACKDAHDADEDPVLVIVRGAKRGEDKLVRLGRVARRLLRTLPSPIVVTPPDLDPSRLGDGPIIAATDTRDDARAACAYAVELGKKLGRSVLLAHVVPMPEHWGASYLPQDSVTRVTQELQASGELALEKWAKEQGFQGHAGVVVQGGVLARLLALADEVKAPMIVVGSHKLNAVARFFVASVGSELAAMAKVPVVVVSPEHPNE
jgi:nucleotide-binding universal stress UspA family protein